MTRIPPTALIVLAALATAASPALAAPKPVTKTYTASAPVPFPGSDAQDEGCYTGQEGLQKDTEKFKVPAAGKLAVEMRDFQGDWDLTLFNGKGAVIGESAALPGTTVEKVTSKVKKGDTVSIVACNYLGTPSATVKYIYTPAK
jgi:hypothetical protein